MCQQNSVHRKHTYKLQKCEIQKKKKNEKFFYKYQYKQEMNQKSTKTTNHYKQIKTTKRNKLHIKCMSNN